MDLYKFQTQIAFTLGGVLVNNINNILKSHLTTLTFRLR